MKLRIPANIEEIVPYPPGKPIEELKREYGIDRIVKLASNENPLGPSPRAVRAMRSILGGLHRYPDGSGYDLTRAIAKKTGFAPEQVVLGNGSNEIIEFLVKALVEPGDEVVSSFPSFLMYQKFVQVRNGVNRVIPLKDMRHDLQRIAASVTDRTRLIFLDNPNNPCATVIEPPQLYGFLSELPEHVVVALDEAYIDFVEDRLQIDIYSLVQNSRDRCGVVALRTLSKAYGLAGVRVGYGLMDRQLAVCLNKVRQPFNLNQLALAGAEAALGDDEFHARSVEVARSGIAYLRRQLEGMGLRCFPSQTNFFLIDVKGDATRLYQALLTRGVIVRSMEAYGFPGLIRINVGTSEENEIFLAAIRECLAECGYV